MLASSRHSHVQGQVARDMSPEQMTSEQSLHKDGATCATILRQKGGQWSCSKQLACYIRWNQTWQGPGTGMCNQCPIYSESGVTE
jgi:hypothetical protein